MSKSAVQLARACVISFDPSTISGVGENPVSDKLGEAIMMLCNEVERLSSLTEMQQQEIDRLKENRVSDSVFAESHFFG